MDASNYNNLIRLTPYELHKRLFNHYVLCNKQGLSLFKRDASRDKRDIDIIKENHRFLWDDESEPNTWEKRLAKKYYDKLFKEFCICDLTYYKENKVAMRWQTEQELINGKGQFICGEKKCTETNELKTWEVNFGYVEQGEKKNALVKLRLCLSCSVKLNYKHRRKEIKRNKRKNLGKSNTKNSTKKQTKRDRSLKNEDKRSENSSQDEDSDVDESNNIWKENNSIQEEPSRDEEFEEYLEHLLL